MTGAVAADSGFHRGSPGGMSPTWTPHAARETGDLPPFYQQPGALSAPDGRGRTVALTLEIAEHLATQSDWNARRRRAREPARPRGERGIDPDSDGLTRSACPSSRFVEIAQGRVGADARVVIMDEPTAIADRNGRVEHLFAVIAPAAGARPPASFIILPPARGSVCDCGIASPWLRERRERRHMGPGTQSIAPA
jgi:hypothetical protein